MKANKTTTKKGSQEFKRTDINCLFFKNACP